MPDQRRQDLGIEHRNEHCPEHHNCLYRLKLLEEWREKINKKLDGFQKLLIANLAGICTLLLTALIGAIVYIAQIN